MGEILSNYLAAQLRLKNTSSVDLKNELQIFLFTCQEISYTLYPEVLTFYFLQRRVNKCRFLRVQTNGANIQAGGVCSLGLE